MGLPVRAAYHVTLIETGGGPQDGRKRIFPCSGQGPEPPAELGGGSTKGWLGVQSGLAPRVPGENNACDRTRTEDRNDASSTAARTTMTHELRRNNYVIR